MAHKFSIEKTITGIPLDVIKQQIGNPQFHEAVCQRVPGDNLELLQSSLNGSIYTLKRAYDLDVKIPDIAKKFLRGAFRLQREDHWHADSLSASARFSMNMPGEFRNKTSIHVANNSIVIKQDWEVEVRVPLIHGLLAKHAEAEIRRFHAIESAIMQDELNAAFR